MINTAIDGLFSFMMWMLIAPAGRTFFFAADAAVLVMCVSFLWFTRNDP